MPKTDGLFFNAGDNQSPSQIRAGALSKSSKSTRTPIFSQANTTVTTLSKTHTRRLSLGLLDRHFVTSPSLEHSQVTPMSAALANRPCTDLAVNVPWTVRSTMKSIDFLEESIDFLESSIGFLEDF